MAARYVIHIGPHKTGSTYLQHAFTQMRTELREHGIDYPDLWGGLHGHMALMDHLASGDAVALQAAFNLLTDRSEYETILLSSETLAYCTDAQVRLLRGLLRGAPVTIVFYVRRWSELIPSHWREVLKHGSRESLQGFALKYMFSPATSEIVNFALVLGRYATAFGADNLRLASYNAIAEAGEDLLSHFCRCFLNWPDPPPNMLGRVNESLDMVDCEVIRTLNALEYVRAGDEGVPLYHRYMALKPELPIGWIVDQSMQFAVNPMRFDDAALGLADLHDRIANQYRYALVPPCPGGRLFSPRAADVLYVHPDYVLRPGILGKMQDIHARLLAANANDAGHQRRYDDAS